MSERLFLFQLMCGFYHFYVFLFFTRDLKVPACDTPRHGQHHHRRRKHVLFYWRVKTFGPDDAFY